MSSGARHRGACGSTPSAGPASPSFTATSDPPLDHRLCILDAAAKLFRLCTCRCAGRLQRRCKVRLICEPTDVRRCPCNTEPAVLYGDRVSRRSTRPRTTSRSDGATARHSDPPPMEAHSMATITTNDGVEIFYKDWGSGQPIVFSHGWPLSADDWDNQMLFFLGKGYRVIAHDRRGHGRSTQVADGHDMDHYADDLAALTAYLRLKSAN